MEHGLDKDRLYKDLSQLAKKINPKMRSVPYRFPDGRLTRIMEEHPPPNECIVDRHNVLEGAMCCFSDSTFNPNARLEVKFKGEDGFDRGGLLHEFMTLALHEISALPIFVGKSPESRDMSLDVTALNKGTYRIIGKMLAVFIVHNGPLPRFFSPLLFKMVAGLENDINPTLDNLYKYDEDLATRVSKIAEATTNKEYNISVNALSDVIDLAGCSMMTLKLSRKQELVNAILRFVMVDRVQRALKQLCEGLNTLGVLECIRESPEIWKHGFTATETAIKLQPSDILDTFDVDWSKDDSHEFQVEQRVHGYWLEFIQEAYENGRLEDVFAWLTGRRDIPVLGFPKFFKSISFCHPHTISTDETATKDFPVVDTCNLLLRLPLSKTYDDFREHFYAALTVTGFPLV